MLEAPFNIYEGEKYTAVQLFLQRAASPATLWRRLDAVHAQP